MKEEQHQDGRRQEPSLQIKKTSISDQRQSWDALAQMEDSPASVNKIHWPGMVGSRLAELEASEGDHMFGLSDHTDGWFMAVDTWSWWVVMQ